MKDGCKITITVILFSVEVMVMMILSALKEAWQREQGTFSFTPSASTAVSGRVGQQNRK